MTDIRVLLAKNIKKYRKLRGFSQEQLAERAKTSTPHIGMIETGKRLPSTQMLMRIAGALGIDTPELFSTDKAHIIPVRMVSLQKMYAEILEDIEKVISKRIDTLEKP